MPHLLTNGTVHAAKANCPDNSPCQFEGGSASCVWAGFYFFPGTTIQTPRVYVADTHGKFIEHKIDVSAGKTIFELYNVENGPPPPPAPPAVHEPVAPYIRQNMRLRSWDSSTSRDYQVEFTYDAFPRRVSVESSMFSIPPTVGTSNIYPEGPFVGLPVGSKLTDVHIWSQLPHGGQWARFPLNQDLGGWKGELKEFPRSSPDPAVRWPKFFPYIEVTAWNPPPFYRSVIPGCTIEFPDGFDAYEDGSINSATPFKWRR